MKEELEKIAEITFTQFMNRHSWFADVGIELRNIQNELRRLDRRELAVNHCGTGTNRYKNKESNHT